MERSEHRCIDPAFHVELHTEVIRRNWLAKADQAPGPSEATEQLADFSSEYVVLAVSTPLR